MGRKGRYVYVCPSCGCQTWSPRSAYPSGKFRDVVSLVDGRCYPSCRRVEQLCYWCELDRYGIQEEVPLPLPRGNAGAANSVSSTSKPLVAGLLTEFSELWAFLIQTTFEDGTARRTGSLSLSFGSTLLGLSLNDAETGQYAFLQSRSLDDLFLEAESRLADGTMPWKASRWNGKKK